MTDERNVIAAVDDDPVVLRTLGRLLSTLGYDSELYESAEAFHNAAAASAASCLLVDIHLGVSSGIELGRQLADRGFKFPMVFMTGSDDEIIREEAMKTGCVAYLRKPFSLDRLTEALAKLESYKQSGRQTLISFSQHQQR